MADTKQHHRQRPAAIRRSKRSSSSIGVLGEIAGLSPDHLENNHRNQRRNSNRTGGGGLVSRMRRVLFPVQDSLAGLDCDGDGNDEGGGIPAARPAQKGDAGRSALADADDLEGGVLACIPSDPSPSTDGPGELGGDSLQHLGGCDDDGGGGIVAAGGKSRSTRTRPTRRGKKSRDRRQQQQQQQRGRLTDAENAPPPPPPPPTLSTTSQQPNGQTFTSLMTMADAGESSRHRSRSQTEENNGDDGKITAREQRKSKGRSRGTKGRGRDVNTQKDPMAVAAGIASTLLSQDVYAITSCTAVPVGKKNRKSLVGVLGSLDMDRDMNDSEIAAEPVGLSASAATTSERSGKDRRKNQCSDAATRKVQDKRREGEIPSVLASLDMSMMSLDCSQEQEKECEVNRDAFDSGDAATDSDALPFTSTDMNRMEADDLNLDIRGQEKNCEKDRMDAVSTDICGQQVSPSPVLEHTIAASVGEVIQNDEEKAKVRPVQAATCADAMDVDVPVDAGSDLPVTAAAAIKSPISKMLSKRQRKQFSSPPAVQIRKAFGAVASVPSSTLAIWGSPTPRPKPSKRRDKKKTPNPVNKMHEEFNAEIVVNSPERTPVASPISAAVASTASNKSLMGVRSPLPGVKMKSLLSPDPMTVRSPPSSRRETSTATATVKENCPDGIAGSKVLSISSARQVEANTVATRLFEDIQDAAISTLLVKRIPLGSRESVLNGNSDCRGNGQAQESAKSIEVGPGSLVSGIETAGPYPSMRMSSHGKTRGEIDEDAPNPLRRSGRQQNPTNRLSVTWESNNYSDKQSAENLAAVDRFVSNSDEDDGGESDDIFAEYEHMCKVQKQTEQLPNSPSKEKPRQRRSVSKKKVGGSLSTKSKSTKGKKSDANQNEEGEGRSTNIWSSDDVQALRTAHRSVDPMSFCFWEDVAIYLDGKSAEECRDKWFSLVKTPNVRAKKKRGKNGNQTQGVNRQSVNATNNQDKEDDLFHSTPFRRSHLPVGDDDEDNDGGDSGKDLIEDDVMLPCDFGSPINHKSSPAKKRGGNEEEDNGQTSDNSPLHLRKGYKGYIKGLAKIRRNVGKRRGGAARTPKIRRDKFGRAISAEIGAGDVQMNGVLTPGGTVQVRQPTDSDLEDLVIRPGEEYSDNEDDVEVNVERQNARMEADFY